MDDDNDDDDRKPPPMLATYPPIAFIKAIQAFAWTGRCLPESPTPRPTQKLSVDDANDSRNALTSKNDRKGMGILAVTLVLAVFDRDFFLSLQRHARCGVERSLFPVVSLCHIGATQDWLPTAIYNGSLYFLFSSLLFNTHTHTYIYVYRLSPLVSLLSLFCLALLVFFSISLLSLFCLALLVSFQSLFSCLLFSYGYISPTWSSSISSLLSSHCPFVAASPSPPGHSSTLPPSSSFSSSSSSSLSRSSIPCSRSDCVQTFRPNIVARVYSHRARILNSSAQDGSDCDGLVVVVAGGVAVAGTVSELVPNAVVVCIASSYSVDRAS